MAHDEDVEMPMVDPAAAGSDLGVEDVLRSSNTKRSSEVPAEELEREMHRERGWVASCMVTFHNWETGNDVYMLLASFVAQAFQVTDHVPLLSGLVDSVQFAPNATSVVVPFGKRLRQFPVVIPAITDNKGNEALSRKQSTSKWPLMLVNIQLSHHLMKAMLKLDLRWRPRGENQDADDLTNQKYGKFSSEKRITCEPGDLPLSLLNKLWDTIRLSLIRCVVS